MAYALWASVVKAATTWFNQAVKNWLDIARLVKVPAVYRGGHTGPGVDNLQLTIYSDRIDAAGNITAGTFFYGTSKTALINSKAAAIDHATNKASVNIDTLTTGVKYFWQFVATAPSDAVGVKSGIYYGYPT